MLTISRATTSNFWAISHWLHPPQRLSAEGLFFCRRCTCGAERDSIGLNRIRSLRLIDDKPFVVIQCHKELFSKIFSAQLHIQNIILIFAAPNGI